MDAPVEFSNTICLPLPLVHPSTMSLIPCDSTKPFSISVEPSELSESTTTTSNRSSTWARMLVSEGPRVVTLFLMVMQMLIRGLIQACAQIIHEKWSLLSLLTAIRCGRRGHSVRSYRRLPSGTGS